MKKLYLMLALVAYAVSADAQTCGTTISTFPYFQNFESGAGGWVAGGNSSSWALGAPVKLVINSAASGSNAWVTNLSGDYNFSEDSYVMGPCFNLSSVALPLITLKIWWNSEFSWDGAVLQSSINGGTTWQNVGAMGDPNNWYTDNSLNGAPGGQPAATAEGWTGRASSGNGSGGWVLAKHTLNGLGGNPSVRLRIAFGSDTSIEDDGFAFDDISIFESPANDVELVAITAPVSSGCGFSGAENVTITIKNHGSAPATNFPVNYQIGSNPPVPSEIFTGTIMPGSTAPFTFAAKANLSTVGVYNVTANTLLANDGNPSNNSLSKTVTVIPTISTLPYSENFENGAGGWVAGGAASSWALGTPAKTVINSAASGTKAWVTSLTGMYNPSENSYVTGPCFNFTGIADPDFEMKIWWNSEFSWDGAVLQSSIDGGATWQNVGAMGDPNNWYTDNSLNGAPGGQPAATAEGWTGRTSSGNGSGGWVLAKHKLTGLGNQASVLLRIAFGSDTSIEDEGFAFDDVRIGDNTGNMAINSFVPLTKICGFGANEPVEVIIENLGSVAESNFSLSYSVDGGPVVPGQQFTGSLAPNTPTSYLFNTTADLSATGNHTIVVNIARANDPEMANNTITYIIANAAFASLPPVFNFETPANGISAMRVITSTKGTVTENVAASNGSTSSKGMIMAGVANSNWQIPAGTLSPWTTNPEHLTGAYICFNPTGGNPSDSLILHFDLKQLFKTANANTNFRVTVNGMQAGPTYRPPFAGGTPVWKTIRVDLTPYKNLGNIQVGLESSVMEGYNNGTGTANLVDNINIKRAGILSISAELASLVSIFPNPSAGILKVWLPVSGKNSVLAVTDLSGKVIFQQKANSQDCILNLSGYAKGIYLLQVSGEGGTAVKKLILE